MRIVMFVQNAVLHDSRVLREAASLVDAGHTVTVVGQQTGWIDSVSRIDHEGFTVMLVPGRPGWRHAGVLGRSGQAIRRVSHGRRTALAASRRALDAAARRLPAARRRIGLRRHIATLAGRRPATPIAPRPEHRGSSADRIPAAERATGQRPPEPSPSRGRTTISTSLWLRNWQYAVLPWARDAAAKAPAADVWHGHDLTGLVAAAAARRRQGSGDMVYDSHELYLESAWHAERPAWARTAISLLEHRWGRRARAVIAVNDAIAAELRSRYELRNVVVVDNCPPRWTPAAEAGDRLRSAAGVPDGTRVALYHGRFAAHRGIEQLAAAILEPGLQDVHAVYLGYGPLQPEIEALVHDPRFAGRLHLLPAVPPRELLDLISTADLEVMAIQPSTLNHRLATGNKLFEALAVGVPVVASDHPGKRLVVQGIGDGPLGELCDPTDVKDVARAMRAILSLSDEERAALRDRCRRAARERWNWEVESAKLIELYDELGRRRRAAA